MTEVVGDPRALRSACDAYRSAGHRVGLVPTMGALHPGHLTLINAARAAGATRTVVSIFVNPLQFAPNEDLDRYPRSFETDLARCEELAVDLIYAPDEAAMYPAGFQTQVRVQQTTRGLESERRPTHFEGVTTVVAKLFNATGPCLAAFGKKDYQQWRTISAMVRDLDMPVEVLGCPTAREADGLAISSRNRYLDAAQRDKAGAIIRGLRAADAAYREGEREVAALVALARAPVEQAFDSIDYVAAADADTLRPLSEAPADRVVLLVAALMGKTRLIDNAVLGHDTLA